ncbi:protein yellow-like [Anthonomus grandis grandis]|uniref:protein yellow-like n=1 Tax=Anthonomus grandis grandis TaxID=2921223 RepID=UPI002165E461|nr:protein yellow-like [Anthonomus grandis grandis]
MALDNWFQNWHPTFFQQPLHHDPIHNSTGKRLKNPTNLLPIYFSLNLLGSEHKNLKGPSKVDAHFPTEWKSKELPFHNFKDDLPGEEYDYSLPLRLSSQPNEHYSSPHVDSSTFEKSIYTKKHHNTDETYEDHHKLKALEITGPFKTWYRWKTLDFAYPSLLERSKAIAKGDFVVENNLPLGIEVYKDRIFMSMPKWKPGVPVTLAQLPRVPKEESPPLMPYPNWDWHSEKSCDLITSVFRMKTDICGRLWVLDSGKISITTEEAKQHCPPKLLIFDLETDELLDKYIFDNSFVKEDSLYSNIIVDLRQGDCHDAYAYMADVWRFGIVVFRLADHHAWRITDHLFYPDPLAASYQLHHLKFEWMDGIFGMALSPEGDFHEDRILYFHPMSSFREFYVKTSYLRSDGDHDDGDAFKIMGESRGPQGHASSSVMNQDGILFYNLVSRDSIGCWDSRKPYKRENLGVVARSRQTLVFPNDIRLDQDKKQSMWIITNRLPYYLIEGLDISRINFRVMSAYTDEAIKGTICDPNVHNKSTYLEPPIDEDCY